MVALVPPLMLLPLVPGIDGARHRLGSRERPNVWGEARLAMAPTCGPCFLPPSLLGWWGRGDPAPPTASVRLVGARGLEWLSGAHGWVRSHAAVSPSSAGSASSATWQAWVPELGLGAGEKVGSAPLGFSWEMGRHLPEEGSCPWKAEPALLLG